jgi:hypothetical protein
MRPAASRARAPMAFIKAATSSALMAGAPATARVLVLVM